MKKNYTDITVVLDRSGSMDSVRDDTRGGFNQFLKDQKAVPGEATFTLVQFDDQYQIDYNAVKIQDVKELTHETYVPRGYTALLDAIGKTIVTLGERLKNLKEEERPEKIIFLIQTDGFENKSTEYTFPKIAEMIKHQTDVYKWEFVFLGADQNAIESAATMGISGTKAMSYAKNTVGTMNAFLSLASNARSYRMGSSKDMSYTVQDRQKQTDAGLDPSLNSVSTPQQ